MDKPSPRSRPETSQTIDFKCACGATEALPASMRGVEQSCAECGRIFRIPFTGFSLDLSAPSEGGDQVMAELASLVRPVEEAAKPSQKFDFKLLLMAIGFNILLPLALLAGFTYLVWWLIWSE